MKKIIGIVALTFILLIINLNESRPKIVDVRSVNDEIQMQILKIDAPGKYLIEQGKNQYIYITASPQMLEKTLYCFKDVELVIENDVLQIQYKKLVSSTKGSSDSSILLQLFNKYNTIQLIENNEEVSFDTVFVLSKK